MSERTIKIKYIEDSIKSLSHESIVKLLHIIRPSVDLADLIEKDGSIYIYYNKLHDDLLSRVCDHIKQALATNEATS